MVFVSQSHFGCSGRKSPNTHVQLHKQYWFIQNTAISPEDIVFEKSRSICVFNRNAKTYNYNSISLSTNTFLKPHHLRTVNFISYLFLVTNLGRTRNGYSYRVSIHRKDPVFSNPIKTLLGQRSKAQRSPENVNKKNGEQNSSLRSKYYR